MASTVSANPFSSPAAALHLTQQTPALLASTPTTTSSFPGTLFSSETPDLYLTLVTHFYACLSTSDDKSAHLLLEKLTARFGSSDPKVIALRGVYQEAIAESDEDLKTILGEYNKILAQDPMNVPVHKRRIGLVKTLGGEKEAIETLTDFLDAWPTDVEGWCELSDLYLKVGAMEKAVWCVEEALLGLPNAWNLHVRAGELEVLCGREAEAVKRFCRAVELCEGYLRGWYGLKVAVGKCLEAKKEVVGLGREKLQRLDQLATEKLEEIVKERNTKDVQEEQRAELIAAQALLNKSSP